MPNVGDIVRASDITKISTDLETLKTKVDNINITDAPLKPTTNYWRPAITGTNSDGSYKVNLPSGGTWAYVEFHISTYQSDYIHITTGVKAGGHYLVSVSNNPFVGQQYLCWRIQ